MLAQQAWLDQLVVVQELVQQASLDRLVVVLVLVQQASLDQLAAELELVQQAWLARQVAELELALQVWLVQLVLAQQEVGLVLVPLESQVVQPVVAEQVLDPLAELGLGHTKRLLASAMRESQTTNESSWSLSYSHVNLSVL